MNHQQWSGTHKREVERHARRVDRERRPHDLQREQPLAEAAEQRERPRAEQRPKNQMNVRVFLSLLGATGLSLDVQLN